MRRTLLGICVAVTLGTTVHAAGFDHVPPAAQPAPPPPPEVVEGPNFLPFVLFVVFAAMGLSAG